MSFDDGFLRPPLWDDITSSIQNIDPENANMLVVTPQQQVPLISSIKIEVPDDICEDELHSQHPPSLHMMTVPFLRNNNQYPSTIDRGNFVKIFL